MPAQKLAQAIATLPAPEAGRPSADLIALSSNELMVAREHAYDPDADALDEDAFWIEYMEAEDDCMVARHVVPFGTFETATWHALAADMFEEPCDERDASQIDRLVERRGLFIHDPAEGARRIALPAVELAVALEEDLKAGRSRVAYAPAHIGSLDLLPGTEPDLYIDPDLLSPAGWSRLSVTIFEKSCTGADGKPFDLVFDRRDLTTGTPLAHARANLWELHGLLTSAQPGDRGRAGGVEAHRARLASSLLGHPSLLFSVRNDRTGTFGAVARCLDARCPGWSDHIPADDGFSPLLALPVDWSGQVEIVGLVEDEGTRACADLLGVPPQLFGLYARRRDGTTVWLGAAPCEADARALVAQLG